MCGRFTLTASGEQVAAAFDLSQVPDISARYNIAPTQPVATVVLDLEQHERRLQSMRWGLIPSWAKDEKLAARMINARIETVMEKPAFRNAVKQRRCLIVADGFYEWQQQGKRKQPYYFHLQNHQLFAFAGLWETWQPPEQAESLLSCTILTTEAAPTVRPIHHRMPAIVPPAVYQAWLDPKTDAGEALSLLSGELAEHLRAYPVSPTVNTPTRESPECIQPLAAKAGEQ